MANPSTIYDIHPPGEADVLDHLTPLAPTEAIGLRFEQIRKSVEGLSQLIDQVKAKEPAPADLRLTSADDHGSRWRELAELQGLRSALQDAARSLTNNPREQRALSLRVGELEDRLAEAEAARQTLAGSLDEVNRDCDRLRQSMEQNQEKTNTLTFALNEASARNSYLDEVCTILREQLSNIESRLIDTDSALVRTQQEYGTLGEEIIELKFRLEQSQAECARLTQLEIELQTQLAAERARSQAAEAAAQIAQNESDQTIHDLEFQVERNRIEHTSMMSARESAQIRAERLDALNTELAGRLASSCAAQEATERKASELQIAFEQSQKTLRRIETEAESYRQKFAAADQERIAAQDRIEQLSRTIANQDSALARSKERDAQLRARFEALQSVEEQIHRKHEDRANALQIELEHERTATALAKAALDSARKDRLRLQMILQSRGLDPSATLPLVDMTPR